MTELRKTALEAGLTQEQFSKVIADNSEALASFGGDVTSGGKKLAKVVGNFGEGTRKELLNLGISVEDQSQGVAEYMATLQRGGSLRYKQDAEIAEGAKDYMVSLKAIAAFTGEDAKKAEQRAKEAAAQGAVDQKLREMGGDANIKFQNLVKQLGPGSEKAAQQMLLFGKIIDPKLAMVFGPTMTEQIRSGIEDVKNGAVTNNELLENAQQFAKENSQVMLAEAGNAQKIFGTVALATGEYGEQMSLASQRATVYNKTFDDATQSTIQTAKDAAATKDPLTTAVSESVAALQVMKTAIQEMFTGPITAFAKDVPGIIAGFKEQLHRMGILERKVERGKESDAAWNQMGTGEKIESGISRTIEGIGAGLNTVLSTIGITALDSVVESAKDARVANEAAYLKNRDASDRNNILPPSLNSVLSVLGLPKFADGGISNGGVLSNGGQLAMVSEGGMAEAHVPLPNGKSIPVEMASGRSGGSDDDFKRQVLENNNLMIAALRQMQEIYTKSMETTKLVSSTIAADSETSAALLEAMNAVVGVLEDSKYELQDQSSSLKKLYDVTA